MPMVKMLPSRRREFAMPVVVKQGRGRDLLFTPTGLEVVDRIRTTFSDWLQAAP
ncbi:hypothetical protein ACIRBY_24965 [Streptomyces sp. NPDC096136]|uniref:hypothetical protein n=1 Tax=Streptomyces sp. NPDC096136 TaxID=3366076 RepID=UPI003806C0EF